MAEATKDFSQFSSPQVNTPEELRDFLEDAVQNGTDLYKPSWFNVVSELPIVSLLAKTGALRELEIFGNLKPESVFGDDIRLQFPKNPRKEGLSFHAKTPVLISDVSAPILIKVLLDLNFFIHPSYPGIPLYQPLEWLVNTYGREALDNDILEKCATRSDALYLFANFITPETLRDYAQNNTVNGDYKTRGRRPYITGYPQAVLDALHKNPSLLDETSFPALKKFFDTALTNHNDQEEVFFSDGISHYTKEDLEALEELLSAHTARTTQPAPAAPAPM